MNRNEQPNLLYHSLHGRINLRGCLPLALLGSAALVGGLLWVLEVRMPHPVRPRGEGQVYYRNDELIHFQMRQRTPLPLNMPAFADPARQESAAAVENDGRKQAEPLAAPAFDFLLSAPDSMVLESEDLLALPPARPAESPAVEAEAQPEEPAVEETTPVEEATPSEPAPEEPAVEEEPAPEEPAPVGEATPDETPASDGTSDGEGVQP